MKKALLAVLLGIGLSILPTYGAICSQTTWLDEPVLAAEGESLQGDIHYLIEYIDTDEPMDDVEADCPEPPHRPTEEETLRTWWEIDHVNDPDIPDELEEACYIYGAMFNISPEFGLGIGNVETGGTYQEDVIDSTGKCWGTFQINIDAQAERIAAYGLTPEDMLTYDGGALVAFSYLAELFDKYEDPAIVLMKYNGASTALKEYRQTGKLNHYTNYVLNFSRDLEEKHHQMEEERAKG